MYKRLCRECNKYYSWWGKNAPIFSVTCVKEGVHSYICAKCATKNDWVFEEIESPGVVAKEIVPEAVKVYMKKAFPMLFEGVL